ncbi:MAG: glycoside hydrolase family 65 protein [Jatrophihabitans sp.]
MIRQSRYPVEPWHVRELGLDFELLAQSESIFALSNGHIGVRGNLDEGDPAGLPGTYLNSFFEQRPLPYAEGGFGYPESGQTLVNVTDGKLIRLLVDDEPFDMRYGVVHHHERILDLRSGLLRRVVEWESPSGRVVRLRSTRLVSFTQRAIMAINWEVEAVSSQVRIVFQSELVANEPVGKTSSDPRVSAMLERPLIAEEHSADGTRAVLIHHTANSQLRMAAGMDHVLHGVDGDGKAEGRMFDQDDWARLTSGTLLRKGQRFGLTKFVAYGWSSQRTLPALRDQTDAALSAVLRTGWEGLVKEQRAAVDEFWDGADVEIEGDPVVQQAVRFGLWHVLQAGRRAEQRAIPAKGLTGPGYDGHAFWDTESFVLPVLTAAAPRAAADALRWRHSTLDLAIERAHALGLRGAAFPWRTIRGQECSAYWPAGTAAFHINADIAMAIARHVWWTGDEDFERECGLPLLVETARLWMSLGYHGRDGKFHIDGVTGPDEYSAVVDDNAYTNLMAARNLTAAAAVAERWPEQAEDRRVTAQEIAAWTAAAAVIAVPFDEERDLPEQDRGWTRHEVWDFAATQEAGKYPLLLHFPYFDIYRKQVSKQADLVLAMHWCGDAYTPEQKAKAFAYYEGVTVRDSSLSACTQAVLAAEVGHLDLAHDYLTEAALMDLRDLEHNTRDGVHVASLAGAWLALVAGFGGMRDHGGQLSFAPRLPKTMDKLSFALRWRGCKVRVVITHGQAQYSLEDGDGAHLELLHHGETFTVSTSEPITLPITPITPITERPTQPAGRKPVRALSAE